VRASVPILNITLKWLFVGFSVGFSGAQVGIEHDEIRRVRVQKGFGQNSV
jgi:hypothetical protein